MTKVLIEINIKFSLRALNYKTPETVSVCFFTVIFTPMNAIARETVSPCCWGRQVISDTRNCICVLSLDLKTLIMLFQFYKLNCVICEITELLLH